jgi:hypothetical protein
MPEPASPSLRPARRQRTQPTLLHWFERSSEPREAIVRPSAGAVVAISDDADAVLDPWRRAGFRCVGVPASDAGIARLAEGMSVAFAFAAPPSADISIAGARWFKRKRARDPQFQQRAVARVKKIHALFEQWACPYMIESPAAGLLRTLWRQPDFTFNPCDYGGHLDPHDAHPLYPEVIPAQDAYTRATGLWVGGGARMPPRSPVPPQWKYFVDKRGRLRRMNPVLYCRTKSGRAVRASAPRGFCRALCRRLAGAGA